MQSLSIPKCANSKLTVFEFMDSMQVYRFQEKLFLIFTINKVKQINRIVNTDILSQSHTD